MSSQGNDAYNCSLPNSPIVPIKVAYHLILTSTFGLLGLAPDPFLLLPFNELMLTF